MSDWMRGIGRPDRTGTVPHFADPSCRCGGPRRGSRFSGLAERADRRTT